MFVTKFMTLKWKKLSPKIDFKRGTGSTKQKENNSIRDPVKFKFFCLSKYNSKLIEVGRRYFKYMAHI